VRRLAPPAAAVGAAVAALGLGGSAGEVTLFASPLVTRADAKVSFSGQISSTAANEYVAVQGKECGVPGIGFRSITGASTSEGGHWTAPALYLQTTTTVRAVWKDERSPVVTVRERAAVSLVSHPRNRFTVGAGGVGRFDGKRVAVERFDTATRTWRRIRTVIVEATDYGGYAEKEVRLKVPKGTTLRAVLPLAQAKPCYLAGYSKLVRT
jgi:hypothetical protein